jgi:hypothetical protein
LDQSRRARRRNAAEIRARIRRPLESRTVRRPWPHASSDNVNRARNTYPQKMAINQCSSFVEYAWRFAMVPQEEIRTRL